MALSCLYTSEMEGFAFATDFLDFFCVNPINRTSVE